MDVVSLEFKMVLLGQFWLHNVRSWSVHGNSKSMELLVNLLKPPFFPSQGRSLVPEETKPRAE